jgi:hypothetical protein
MFKRLVMVCLLAATASPAPALVMGPHWFPESFEPARELHVVYFDVENALPWGQSAVQLEATRLLSRAGVEVHWRRGGLGVMARPDELTVVLLARAGTGSSVGRHVLGATIPGEQGSRAVWVYLPHVAATLGLDPERPGNWDAASRSQLPTALARVAAHEILHALAPGEPHAATGLMAERMGRATLVGSAVDVPFEFQRALRPSLRRRAANDD